MRLLFVCHELPSPSNATSLRALHSIRYLSEKYGHDITLVAFKLARKDYPELSTYCRVETIDMPSTINSLPKAIVYTLRNMISPYNIFSRNPCFLNYYYSPNMERRIKGLLKNRFDVIVVDFHPMLCYALNKRVPLVLLETHAVSEMALMYYRLERSWFKKVARLLQYYQAKGYVKKYRAANVSIAVSAHQRDMVRSHCPDLNIVVIPYGIDTDYLRAVDVEQEFPTLIITGMMDRLSSVRGVLWFYNEVYPLIKVRVPQVKLYIVGSNPGNEILQLAADKSVVVTGYVEDLRPYLSHAWVVAAPLQEGFGVKVRVLQAMAVGKPVVATSTVTGGIDVSPGQDIIIADSPTEFAEKAIELLNDRRMREEIGTKARLLMETNHSWENLTDRLNEVLGKAAKARLLAQR